MRSISSLEGVGLEVATRKGFGAARPAENGRVPVGDERFVLWGTEVHSQAGTVGTPPRKRLAIASLFWQVLIMPITERQLVERCLSLPLSLSLLQCILFPIARSA